MAMFIGYYSHTSDTTSPASFITETNRSAEPRVGASLAHVRTAGARTLRWRYRRICYGIRVLRPLNIVAAPGSGRHAGRRIARWTPWSSSATGINTPGSVTIANDMVSSFGHLKISNICVVLAFISGQDDPPPAPLLPLRSASAPRRQRQLDWHPQRRSRRFLFCLGLPLRHLRHQRISWTPVYLLSSICWSACCGGLPGCVRASLVLLFAVPPPATAAGSAL